MFIRPSYTEWLIAIYDMIGWYILFNNGQNFNRESYHGGTTLSQVDSCTCRVSVSKIIKPLIYLDYFTSQHNCIRFDWPAPKTYTALGSLRGWWDVPFEIKCYADTSLVPVKSFNCCWLIHIACSMPRPYVNVCCQKLGKIFTGPT